MTPINLRPAKLTDARYILELEEQCMRGYAIALWGNWQPSETVETLKVDGHEIIEKAGKTMGCVAVVWHPDHLFIKKLYIGPGHQGQGVGAQVLRHKTQAAANEGLPTKLSVLTTNPADRFYRREGFSVESETPERRRMVKPLPAGQ